VQEPNLHQKLVGLPGDPLRQEHCRGHGHDFGQVIKWGCLAPQSVVCKRCGAEWRIHPDDIQENFGMRCAT
jgi:hypothetical protein